MVMDGDAINCKIITFRTRRRRRSGGFLGNAGNQKV
jgi:hypothetical protein